MASEPNFSAAGLELAVSVGPITLMPSSQDLKRLGYLLLVRFKVLT